MKVFYPRSLSSSIYERMGTMYRVKYSQKQGSWYIDATEGSEDLGTSLYDTEEEAFADLTKMVGEGLVSQSEIARSEIRPDEIGGL